MRRLRKEFWIQLIALAGILYTVSLWNGPASWAHSLQINEVMASNGSIYADPQQVYDDWVEIYNGRDLAVDLGGMYLTDNLEDPTKWQVPSNRPTQTTIAPGGHLIIWADKDTEDTPGLHAAFSLDADGESLALFDSNVTLIDSITFDQQRLDVSFGRFPDGADSWRLMVSPTPGSANIRIREGFLQEVAFSHDRGFYEDPILVTLTTETQGAEIWYTTNGSEPNSPALRGVNGSRYVGPIEISRTTCLRAKAFKPNWEPSNTCTHTYVFLTDVLHQPRYPDDYPRTWGSTDCDYEMDPEIVNAPLYRDVVDDALLTHRTMSLTFDIADLFDASEGIYVNPEREGDSWERPVSVEIIDPNGHGQVHINAGLRIQGGASRNPSRPKHNMRLFFKSQYGASKLNYPMFDNWPVHKFNTLVLRGGNGDSWIHPTTGQQIEAQYIRDQWPRDIQYAMGHQTSGQCYVHLYLNGLYWGLYHIIERPDDAFFVEHFGGDREDYDVLQHKGGTVAGNRDAWNAMMAIARNGLVTSEAYTEIQHYVDIPNLIDYLLINFYNGNVDWDHNNWYGGRRRTPEAGFQFFPWDSERTFLGLTDNRTGINNSNQPSELHQRLSGNAEYRMLFADHIHRHFFNDGVLTVDGAREKWLARAEEIRLALVAESARWGDAKRPSDPYTPDVEWQAELDYLCNTHIPQRTDIVLTQLKNRGLYPSVEAPNFSQYGGTVVKGYLLDMTAPAGTIWYTIDGPDPRVATTTVIDPSEQTLIAEDTTKSIMVPTGPVDEAWRINHRYNEAGWFSGTGGIGYDTGSGYESYIDIDVFILMYTNLPSCYIRIPFTLDHVDSHWQSMSLRIRYDDGFVAYLNGIEIARRNVEGDPTWDSTASGGHPDADAIVPESVDVSAYISHLRPGGNLLAIHGLNTSVTSSDFLISAELVAGSAQEIPGMIHPDAVVFERPIELDQSAKVKARVLNGGTWSALNEAMFVVGPIAEKLKISELMYNPPDLGYPDDPNTEYIELVNVGDEAINLNRVTFTDGIEFTFGSFELVPDQYCLVVKDIAAFQTKYGTDLNVAGQYTGSLSNGGEHIELKNPSGQIIAEFNYRDDWYDTTDGSGFSLTVIDPAITESESLNDKNAWRPSAIFDGSPGFDDSNRI